MGTSWDDITPALEFANYLDATGRFQTKSAIVRWAAHLAHDFLFSWMTQFTNPRNLFGSADPFVHDNWLYGTNDEIVVRVRTFAENTCDLSESPLAQNINEMVETFHVYVASSKYCSEWKPWPKHPIRFGEKQRGSGQACPICRSERDIFINNWRECVYCGGTGFVGLIDNAQIGTATISGDFWIRISELPNVMFREATPEMPIWFRFLGGEGFVVQMTQPHRSLFRKF